MRKSASFCGKDDGSAFVIRFIEDARIQGRNRSEETQARAVLLTVLAATL